MNQTHSVEGALQKKEKALMDGCCYLFVSLCLQKKGYK